jgi:ribonuclease HI
MAKRNYYAVVKGAKPGIYASWFGPDGAEAQVKGFVGARYKGFTTLEDAETWFESQSGTKAPRYIDPPGPLEEQDRRSGLDDKAARALEAGKVVIYTDGGSIGNPGPGGYGVVLLHDEQRQELSGGFRWTTNNRMELMACIIGLRALEKKSQVVLFSDSRYVVDSISKGSARRWKANRWMRGKTGKAKNADLWDELLQLIDRHEVEFVWVPGHSGVPENERCDQLSIRAASQKNLSADEYFEKEQNNQLTLL